MFRNVMHAHAWIETSLETIAIAIMFEYTQIGFVPIHPHFPPHPFDGVALRISDPYIPLLIGLAGMFGLVISAWNIHKWGADMLRNSLFMFIYTFLLIVFLFHEVGTGGHIGAMTILCGTTWLRVAMQWLFDAYSGQNLVRLLERWR